MPAVVGAVAGAWVTSSVTRMIAGTAIASTFIGSVIPAAAGALATFAVSAALPIRPAGEPWGITSEHR